MVFISQSVQISSTPLLYMTDPTHKPPIQRRHVIPIVNLTEVAVTVQRQGLGSNHAYIHVVSQFKY